MKHPTAAWPPKHTPSSVVVEADAPESAKSYRRTPRALRQSPTVPFPYLITCVLILSALIMMVVKQRAELVKEQYKLVDLRVQRAKALKERGELKLNIQRLSALDRVDEMVRTDLKMVRPEHRTALDLNAPVLATAPDRLAVIKAQEATP